MKMKNEMKQNNAPVKKVRVSNITVDMWENVTNENKTFISISIQKAYKVNEEWKNGTSFSITDLPKLALAVGEAYKWYYMEYVVSNATVEATI